MDLGAWEDGEVIWRDKDEKFIFKPQYDWNECFISFSISNCNRKKILTCQEGAMLLVVWLIGMFGV